jgi:hypothetical protein
VDRAPLARRRLRRLGSRLDELKERGYNAVRIDPFPRLLAADPQKTWILWPEWNTQMWGSPDVNRIVLVPALFQFIGKCRDCGIEVGTATLAGSQFIERSGSNSPTQATSSSLKTNPLKNAACVPRLLPGGLGMRVLFLIKAWNQHWRLLGPGIAFLRQAVTRAVE